MKEEQNRARDVGRSSRGTHTGKSPITYLKIRESTYNLPFPLQVVDLLEVVRLALALTTVLFAHTVHFQVAVDEAVPAAVEEVEVEEVDFY